MPNLQFSIEVAEVLQFAAAPTLILKLRVLENSPAEPIQNVLLQCQIQIEALRRRYTPREQRDMRDLFGTPDRWGDTLRSLHWTRTNLLVPPFVGEVVVDLHVPCSYDFNLTATKFFHALEDGEIPLLVLFSGSVFYRTAEGSLQVTQIPWNREARYRLPVGVWRDMMDAYYPNTAWLALRQDVFDRLNRFKSQQGLLSWEQAMERLLTGCAEEVAP